MLLFLCINSSCFSQNRKTKSITLRKEEFIHTWNLVEIRNRANQLVTKEVDKKTIQFTNDSVFIVKNDSIYRGTWKFEKQQFQIDIPNCSNCNYKWFSYDNNVNYKLICFKIGDNSSKLECFRLTK